MAAPRTDPAVFAAIASALEWTHGARPDLPPTSPGKGDSILSLALRSLAANSPEASYNTWRSRWANMKSEFPHLIPAFMGFAPAAPSFADAAPAAAQPAPRSLDDDVAYNRARRDSKDAKASLADALKRIAQLQDKVDDIERLRQSNPRPAEWTLPGRCRGGEHIPELLTSDFQIGEVIKPEETDGAHGYDVDIFRRRYRLLISTTIDLCLNHAGEGWTYPGIIYLRGGDTISGGIHEELAETDQLTPVESVMVAVEEESAGILKLAEAFGRVEVKSTPGNHDRDTHKPRSKNAAGHSFDTIVEAMLRMQFAGDARVTFQGSKSPDIFYPIYGRNYLLTHGDKIGSRGGQGFIGPAATIARGFQKVIQEQALLGRHVERVRCGHFHTQLVLEQGDANGCLPGYSEFAKLHRMRPAPPSQWLMFHHPEWGIVDWKKIYLERRA